VPESEAMGEILSRMNEEADERVVQLEADLEATHRREKMMLFGFGGLITLGAIFLVLYLNSNIVKPILKIAGGLRNVEAGELDTELEIESNNEIGYLAENFNRMLEPLKLERISAEILETLASGYDRDMILENVMQEMAKIPGVVSLGVYIYNEWEDKLVLAQDYALSPDVKKDYQLGEGLIGEVAEHNKIETVVNPDESWQLETGVMTISLKNITGFPVYYKDKLLAVLVAGSTTELSQQQKRQLKHSVSQLGITLNNIKQYTSIQQLVEKLEGKNEELKQQKNYAEAVLNSSADGIFSVDQNRRIKTWSRGAEKITGYSSGEVRGKIVCDVIKIFNDQDEHLCKEDKCFIEELTADKDIASDIEVRVKNKEGQKIPCQFSVATIYDHRGQPNGSVQVFRDISRQKANILKMEKANKVKSEFLATMSHELRTPLNSVLGFAELLENKAAGPLTEKQKKYLENIISSGRHLLSLINDILDISKIESGEMTWQPTTFNLKQLLKNCLLMVRGIASKSDIKLNSNITGEGLQNVEGDERKLKQIVHNLLQNAVKFTSSGGEIGLKAWREGDYVNIQVWDTGIGIPEDKQDTIFEPFVQLDSKLNRQYEGTGLGLDLVKKMTELCGGEIEVESSPGEGSKFTVILPLKQEIREERLLEQEEEIAAAEKEEKEVKTEIGNKEEGKLALIIENEYSSAELIREYLRELGYDTLRASDGREGLDLAFEHCDNLDLITLDLMLPEYEGWEILHELSQKHRTSEIPVIIISVLPEREKGLALGAFNYLYKPLSREKLQSVADKIKKIGGKKTAALLAIDDEPLALEIIEEVLGGEGFKVNKAYSGKEGLKKASALEPDAILLDLMMPGMDGFEVINELKADPELREIPIIIVTAKVLTVEDKKRLTDRVYLIANKSELKLDSFKKELEKAVAFKRGD
ncbi:MAG: response regulator, partial [Halanaerobiales bacterium]